MNYDLLCFSILWESRRNLVAHVGKLFHDRHKLKNISITTTKSSLSDWAKPRSGAMPSFFLGTSEGLDYCVFFSNLSDGWHTAARFLASQVQCKFLNVKVSDIDNPSIYSYSRCDNSQEVRVIQALKEDRWTYFEEGDKLSYEREGQNKSRRILDRLNLETIEYFLKEENVMSIDELLNTEFDGIRLDTLSWKYC